MHWIHYVSWWFGGAFVANAVPHLVSGMMGRPFQSPFAKPSGEGFSSSTVNVCWGSANAVVGYLLLGRVGDFQSSATVDAVIAGLGAFLMSLFHAKHFGRFNGGSSPLERPSAERAG